MAATSSFTEGSSVFGGQSNLLQALETIFKLYDPDVIAVHTTCLSETIGDDIPQIIGKALAEGKIPAGKLVIHTNTPSYIGSHVTGFANMVKSMVDYLAVNTGTRHQSINLIPGWVEPADMRELKRLAHEMGIKIIMFPDTSDVLDTPLTGKYVMYPKGGATLEDIRLAGDARATIALGNTTSGPAAKLLDTKCKVPCSILDLPIGLPATDRFIDRLRCLGGVSVPDTINEERGRLLDLMSDMHQYTYGKTVALAGDPDQLVSLTEFLISLDMKVKYIVTGTSGKNFIRNISEVIKDSTQANGIEETKVGCPGDLFLLHQWIKQEKVDLLMANTYGKYIARDENLPFVRFGFPILDRIGHSYFPTLGYTGAIRLIEKILAALMDRQDAESPVEKLELVM
jgi:nitrogenase molybdenum-iron protein beta chain